MQKSSEILTLRPVAEFGPDLEPFYKGNAFRLVAVSQTEPEYVHIQFDSNGLRARGSVIDRDGPWDEVLLGRKGTMCFETRTLDAGKVACITVVDMDFGPPSPTPATPPSPLSPTPSPHQVNESSPLPLVTVQPVGGLRVRPSVRFNTSTGEHRLWVELATTPQEWETGLMNRTSLANDSGMLFVFDQQKPLYFWMKDTLIPLDMVFVSSAGVVVNIAHDAPPCKADPCPIYRSGAPALYVVEANGGYAEKIGLKIGDSVGLPSNDQSPLGVG